MVWMIPVQRWIGSRVHEQADEGWERWAGKQDRTCSHIPRPWSGSLWWGKVLKKVVKQCIAMASKTEQDLEVELFTLEKNSFAACSFFGAFRNKVLSFGDDGDADDSIVIMFDDFHLDSTLVGSNVEPGEETVVGKTPLIRPVLLPGQINHLRTKWTGRVIMENYLCKLGHLLLLWNLFILSLFWVSLAFSLL